MPWKNESLKEGCLVALKDAFARGEVMGGRWTWVEYDPDKVPPDLDEADAELFRLARELKERGLNWSQLASTTGLAKLGWYPACPLAVAALAAATGQVSPGVQSMSVGLGHPMQEAMEWVSQETGLTTEECDSILTHFDTAFPADHTWGKPETPGLDLVGQAILRRLGAIPVAGSVGGSSCQG